ncbi:hypothetical protein [Streptomyces gibsoniae]|uniref:Uncharacterized protein n=1 Tax=Streptomyces gibsoniae TaxID=3075529 RepID=A0ABU2U8F8_9ACTN|nr:hypothetical protein [Streptomyces sp. DSM 41699]MDT0469519.1 hypothetical protein [Streptomyces sp. DSM 41699]
MQDTERAAPRKVGQDALREAESGANFELDEEEQRAVPVACPIER